jgi:Pvc16 N-terminal domain/Carboxypeptidase regulatory-like domain
MLGHIDNMLRQLFITKVPTITEPLQVRFQPPDDEWHTYVNTLQKPALNVYLVEMRENRMMRLTARTPTVNGNLITVTPLPRYVDVHYLITAWDPATAHPAVEPNLVEHELLWGVTRALMDADPLDPIEIYAPSPLPPGFPAFIKDAELPTTVLPPEGFGKHAEFWGTMPGDNNPWRPAVMLVLTLPVVLAPYATYPMVTTRITEYDVPEQAGETEVWAEIGGTVTDATVTPPVVVSGASVAIFNTSGLELASTASDSLGRFVFNLLRPGNYQLQFSAPGHPAAPSRAITVPSPTGEYNLQFT